MVSGSAALPVSTLERWQEITGHMLLERYGMTELGIALSNTLERRVPGKVGEPLPNVSVRVVDDTGYDVPDGAPGELLVRGPQVFLEYWRRPAETAAVVHRRMVPHRRRRGARARRVPAPRPIVGRHHQDRWREGVGARDRGGVPDPSRCRRLAVVGVPDPEWGERVCAAMVVDAAPPPPTTLRAWGKERLAAAKVPSRFAFVAELPRNSMGKVTKADVGKLFA